MVASPGRLTRPVRHTANPLWYIAAACVGLGLYVSADTSSLPVVLPIMGVLGAMTLFFLILRAKTTANSSLLEVGGVYVTIVALYAAWPLVGYLSTGLQYTPTNDGRLFSMQPGPTEVGAIGWYYVAHLAAFAFVYLAVRGRAMPFQGKLARPRPSLLRVAVALLIAGALFTRLIEFAYDLHATSYSDSYLMTSRLPLAIAQVYVHVEGIKLTLKLVILAALFCDYYRYRWAIAGWLLLQVVTTLLALGSRTDLMIFGFASVILYHLMVRPIPMRTVQATGLAGLVLFLLLGLLRDGWDVSDLQRSFNPLARTSEFESVFANAVDIQSRHEFGTTGDLNWTFYFSDLLSLIPQQFVPVKKVNPAVWYVSTFYSGYAEQGGGLAFGTISESILGWGLVDCIVRGSALGWCLAMLHRFCTRQPGFWVLVLYVWTMVWVYQSVRGSTFYELFLFVYHFLPACVAVGLLTAREKPAAARLPFAPAHRTPSVRRPEKAAA